MFVRRKGRQKKWDHKRNDDILTELKKGNQRRITLNVGEKTAQYMWTVAGCSWAQCRPRERESTGRPQKRGERRQKQALSPNIWEEKEEEY
jgi:hypothetical protein